MEKSDNLRILIIDDNLEIHRDFIKILTANHDETKQLNKIEKELFGQESKVLLPSFTIDTATQGQEGVKRVKEALDAGKPYSLAFVDIRMPPGWDGIETIKHIWEIDKNIQIVICTAYSDYSWEKTIEHLGMSDNLLILKKPFDNVAVRQLAYALTTKWKLAEQAKDYTNSLKREVADRTLSLQKSLSLVKSTFESSSDGILVVSNDMKIIDYNHKFLEMMEIPPKVINKKDEEAILTFIKSQIEGNSDFINKVLNPNAHLNDTLIDTIQLANGNIYECYTQPHKLNGKIIGRILDFRDITKRAKLERELQYQSTHDSLTGLANRVRLYDHIRQCIKECSETNTSFAVLFLDFDRFKLINDSLSHAVGDELLQAAAVRLQGVLNEEELLARLGGDEFIVVCKDIRDNKDIEKRIQQLLTVFEQPFDLPNRKITVTVSVGVSEFPKDGSTVDVLLRNADAAMYRAKEDKTIQFKFYDPRMNIDDLAELDLEIELRHALENNELFLCYQPQLDLMDQKLVAVEALIRWQHPTRGILLPIDFIPTAEASGLIVPINEWVMRTACKQNKIWQDKGLMPIRIAVNVTAEQFKQSNLPEIVESTLKETGLKPEYLELELTEHVLLSNSEVIRAVNALKKLGVSIAIDDFGTGYSSLSYISKIPLDRLKIDSSFIQHIHSATDDEVIIRAILAMAKSLKLEVLAEGVETQDQVNFLKKNKCGDVQGFYFSKPLYRDELEMFLKKNAASTT